MARKASGKSHRKGITLLELNLRESDTIGMMAALTVGVGGKWFRYRDLIVPNGLSSGARSA